MARFTTRRGRLNGGQHDSTGSSRHFAQYPEIAIFLTLAIGYYFGKFTFKGIGLGAVTATLLAGVLIGQIGITISQPLKATVFLMFLFAVGYGVGPQFVRGVAKDGLPQALFSVVQCVLSLAIPVAIAKLAGYDLGYAAGLYCGIADDLRRRWASRPTPSTGWAWRPTKAKAMLDSMPVAYAVTYMFGTVGSAIVIARARPGAAPHQSPRRLQGLRGEAGRRARRWAAPARPGTAGMLRAFRVKPGGKAVGLRAVEAEALVPDARIFVLRIRRNGKIEEATADTVLREGDVVAVAGAREVLVKVLGEGARRSRTRSC